VLSDLACSAVARPTRTCFPIDGAGGTHEASRLPTCPSRHPDHSRGPRPDTSGGQPQRPARYASASAGGAGRGAGCERGSVLEGDPILCNFFLCRRSQRGSRRPIPALEVPPRRRPHERFRGDIDERGTP
jgi:hypothetical protein